MTKDLISWIQNLIQNVENIVSQEIGEILQNQNEIVDHTWNYEM